MERRDQKLARLIERPQKVKQNQHYSPRFALLKALNQTVPDTQKRPPRRVGVNQKLRSHRKMLAGKQDIEICSAFDSVKGCSEREFAVD